MVKKKKQSLPRGTFPEGFSTSFNETHYSYTEQLVKHSEEIILQYVNEERRRLGNPDQFALLLWDILWSENGNRISFIKWKFIYQRRRFRKILQLTSGWTT